MLEMLKIKTKKNIPIHDTKSVLDLSKILIHNFYYDYMIPKWSKNNDLY